MFSRWSGRYEPEIPDFSPFQTILLIVAGDYIECHALKCTY